MLPNCFPTFLMRNSEHDMLINDLEICGLAFCIIHDLLILWFILGSRVPAVKKEHHSGLASGADLSPGGRIENNCLRRKMQGVSLDVNNLQMLDEKRDIFYLLSFILQNTKPVGHQVYLVMTIFQTKLVLVLALVEN